MSFININCRKCDRNNRCRYPKVKDGRLFFLRFRPICKLLPPYRETILENGDVIQDTECKYQTKYPKPIRPPKGQSGSSN